MHRYLSPAWISASNAALAASAPFSTATRDTRLVIQNVVTGVDGASVAYALVLDHGTNRLAPGVDPDADVSFTCDHATAVAIATGTESAQVAFMAGRLQIGGDARVLIAHQGVLADLDDVLADVRALTDHGIVPAGS